MAKSNDLLKVDPAKDQMIGKTEMYDFYAGAYRVGTMFSKSDLVPDTFKARPENCMIALNISNRIGADPLMVMQNLYLVHGKPAWSSQFLISCINASKKFSPLRYKMTGTKGSDNFGCVAWAKDALDGEVLESPEITVGMAKKEGWYTKNGSKWQSMPELMLRYRAATLFARLYAPELTMGIQTQEEVIDVQPVVTDARPSRFEKASTDAEEAKPETPKALPEKSDLEKLADLIAGKGIPVSADEVKKFVEGNGEIFSFDMVKPNINAIADAILTAEESK